MTVWWLGRGQHMGISMFDQKLWDLFGDPKGAVKLAQKGLTLHIASKVVSLKCVSRDCSLSIPMDSLSDKS